MFKEIENFKGEERLRDTYGFSIKDMYSKNYGKLEPICERNGFYYVEILRSDLWELLDSDEHISAKNDNRLDRYYGYEHTYQNKRTNEIINVDCHRSATGKTVCYHFYSYVEHSVSDLQKTIDPSGKEIKVIEELPKSEYILQPLDF